ncbi:ComEC/Rec2 family competence protein [Roseivirga sp.]|uniref:ComEC/Rec2 family competence protein n=1 Tax=Roseivirga sp. TaxID=1964215 RepID=UPI002B27B400|nr:ComEC/Rec2 family competence protein [Roseivirga sp.]
MNFSAFPFIRFSAAFILGVVVYHYCHEWIDINFWLPSTLFVLYVFLAIRNSLRFQYLLSVLALTILFCCGFLRLKEHRIDNSPDHLLYINQQIETYRAVIYEEPAMKANSINVRLQVTDVLAEQWQAASGYVNAYVSKEAGAKLQYGDVLLVKGAPNLTEAPANPGEFHFKNYLVYNNIFHQQFIGEDFQLLGSDLPWWKWPIAASIRIRNQCAELLKARISDPDARGVLLAITLGVKDELDTELQTSFSAAGAMHVLAVSGLHVGIIYGIIVLVFKRIKLNTWKRRWWMAVISIALLWCYAFITGLSPSVLRAVTMFSFVAIAKAKNTNSSIYNTLAASAFVLLCWNPYLIMSVGFQLSYLAVFGIVYLQPKFYGLFDIHNLWLDKVWAISCVSLAAQIATAPLSMLYFHQFPSYFLFSNLFVIPAAFAMLVMGLSVLALGAIPYMGEAVGWLTETFVRMVNALVHWVRWLPGSTMDGIHLTTGETWLIYGVILMLIILMAERQFKYMIWSVAFCALFALSQINHWKSYENAEFSVLNVSGESVLDFRVGNKSKLVADTSFSLNLDRIQFHLEPKRQLAGSSLLPSEDQLELVIEDLNGHQLIVFEGQRIFKLNQKIKVEFERPVEVDYLILSNESVYDLADLDGKFEFQELIIDKSNRKFLSDKLTNQAETLNLKVHSIYRDGYYSRIWKK